MTINYPLSVIDGKKVSIKDAFSWVLNYYNPNKKSDIDSKVLDSTCSKMKMWKQEDFVEFTPVTNDIRKEVNPVYNFDVGELHKHLDHNYFDIIIFDPPYINLNNRQDTDKYEETFNYTSVETLNDLEELTKRASKSLRMIIKTDGVLIAKITNFHTDSRIHGTYDFYNWFKPNFYLFDEVIYRFFKHIPNLNWYSVKCAKTHSYFMIFKPEKDIFIEKDNINDTYNEMKKYM